MTISGNSTTAQGFGVVLAERESTNIMNALTISSSGTVRRHPNVTLTGAGTVAPTPILNPMQPEEFVPRALSVQPIKDVPTVGQAAPAKCVHPASPREVLIFPASDPDVVTGAGNILSLEAIFSLAGDDATGNNGPDSGAQGCHFIFRPPADLSSCNSGGCGSLKLDGDSGGSNWGPQSVVGVGGRDLSNSYCKIRAGSSESGVVAQGKVLKLTLDIEFLNSTKKHIYMKIQNRDDVYSDGGAWRYWGWWSPAP